jgi:hypothetical protein
MTAHPTDPRARRARSLALTPLLLTLAIAAAACGDDESGTSSEESGAPGNGKVTVVYHDDEIEPANRPAFDLLQQSGVLDQLADGLNSKVGLPKDITVTVSDVMPPGIDDMSTAADGGTIWVPGVFLNQIHGLTTEIAKDPDARPEVYPESEYNADGLMLQSVQFIFGHELGHALQRMLLLANLGLEEDAADGYASFATLNEVGPEPSLATALLFDEMARHQETVTLEEYSSDHPVLQARVFNFLCYTYGDDPQAMASLVPTYLPKSRSPMCPQAWAQLDYGWWTQLQPSFHSAFAEEGDAVQAQSKQRLLAEMEAFAEIMTEIRLAQQ